MSLHVHLPRSPQLREVIECVYVFSQDDGARRAYTSFPSVFTNLSLLRGADVSFTRQNISIQGGDAGNTTVVLRQNLLGPCRVDYKGRVEECTVYFKPLGIHFFPSIQKHIGQADQFVLVTPDSDPFHSIFQVWADTEPDLLFQMVEEWLLALYIPFRHRLLESMLKAFSTEPMPSTHALASELGVSRQLLHRQCSTWFGLNPSQYRKVMRFRKASIPAGTEVSNTRLTEIAYAFDFFDQSHMIRDFRTLTGYVPKEYFRRVHRFLHGAIQWLPH